MKPIDDSFIKFKRSSEDFKYLIKSRPTAFALLSLIAQRARRTLNHPDPELQMGDALIGDYKSYGVSRRVYRTDLDYLRKYQFVTTQTTNKGTIARIVKTTIFDINAEERPTNRPDRGQQEATNNNDKNEKKDIPEEINHLSPLTDKERYSLALELKVDIPEIRAKEQAVLDPDNIRKYNLKDTKRTVRKWIKNDITNGRQRTLDHWGMEILKGNIERGVYESQ